MTPQRLALPLVLLLALAVPQVAQAAKHTAKPAPQYYVSLGDSYATGYQGDVKHNTRNGFAYQLPKKAAKRGYDLKLVNFGCAGATTSSILNQTGCPAGLLGPGGTAYPTTTQAKAAEAFIRKNRKNIRLITVSIGGNDVTACAKAADAIGCVGTAITGINENVATLVKGLRAAAGFKARIVGITYPDVILGAWITGGQDIAKLSVVAFQQLINPALKKQYESVKGTLVDVTAATGAYESLDQTTTLAPYGVIPVPVAKVCQLTYYCQYGDIHARTPGYGLIADLIVKTLPKVTAKK